MPTASLADVTVDEGAGTMTLTLRLNHPSQADIAYFTRDDEVTGTATEGEDYDDFLLETGRIATITVPAGDLSQTFDITIVDDGMDEPDETIIIIWQKLSTSDVTPSTFNFTGTIVPEPLPALSFAPNIVDVDEDAGTATLTVELAPASTGTVTVDFATRDGVGGAKAGEDYTATSGTLTFTAGQTSKTFTVPITDDDVYENGLESFQVDLSNPTGATVPAHPSAVVRIDSEDAVPTASMAPVTVDEGAGTMTLTLRLSHLSDADIGYFTIYDEDIATGTATEGDDYDDFLLGSARTARITVPAGELSQTFDVTEGRTARITVHLNAPWKPERNEALTVPLFDPQHQGGASADDYSGVQESVTFQPGQTRASFTVRVADGTGTGFISNTDKMPGAWLTRFGRAATDHVVEAVGERWQGGPQTPHLTLGGRQAGDLFGWAGRSGLGGRSGRDTAVDRDDPVGTDPSSMGWLAPSGGTGAGIGATVPGMTLSLGDMNTAPGGAGGVEREAGKTLSGRAAQGALLRALGLPDPRAVPDLRTLLMGSSFFYSEALDEDGESRSPGWLGEWSAWGRTASSRFSGADGSVGDAIPNPTRQGRFVPQSILSFKTKTRVPAIEGGARNVQHIQRLLGRKV